MNIQRTVLATHPLIRNTLLIVPLLLVIVVYVLREGITIDTLKIGTFQVEGLYLKLDKKLVANVQYLHIPGRDTKLSSDQIQLQLDRVKKLPRFFQHITLNNVAYGQEHYRIIYRDHVFYLRNSAYEVAGMFERKGDEVHGQIPYLYIPKYRLQVTGKFRFNYRNGDLHFKGDYRYRDIDGHFSIAQTDKTVRFVLNTGSFAHTHTLMDLPGITDEIREWVDRRLAAKGYQAVLLRGTLQKRAEGYRLDPRSLSATFKLDHPVVRFDDRLERIRAHSAEATLKNDVLYIRATHPTYAGKDLNGSRMFITNLFGKKPGKLHLEIRAETGYDASVAKVLRTYGLTLPFLQHTGTARNRITLDIPLGKDPVTFKGHTRLGRGTMTLFGQPAKILGGEVAYDDHRVQLHGVDLDWGWLHAKYSGTLKLNEHSAKIKADVKHLQIGTAKSPLVQMKNKHKIPINVHWTKQPVIDLPLYKTRIVFDQKGGFELVCDDLKPARPYLTGIPKFVTGGSVRLKTPDGKRYTFSGDALWPTSCLYDKQGTLTRLPFTGSASGSQTRLSLLKGRMHYASRSRTLKLSDLYIDARKLFDQNLNKSQGSTTDIRVQGSRSLIRYDKYVLLTDTFDLKLHGKNTTFVATKDGDTVRAELNGDALVVKAHRIKAPMLRALVHFGGLQGGRYSLDLHGDLHGTLHGVITIVGGVVSNFKTYNNMIALFNTVPALASLSDPGFSKQGFEVRSGRIEFRVVKNRVYFDMIYIDGRSAAISGKGTVSTLNGAINMDLAVRTARGIGKLIGSLPIVGYILMGEDKSITTGVKVTGTLENPKVTTHVVLETLLTPFQMMIRTIKSPAHLLNQPSANPPNSPVRIDQ